MRKPLDLPAEVAHGFIADMHAFFTAESELKRDEIAARQRHILLQHMSHGARLRLSEIRMMFAIMREEISSRQEET